MSNAAIPALGLALAPTILVGDRAADGFSQLKGVYSGQTAPKEKAEVFLDGIVSTLEEPEMCAAFAVDGKESYFNARHGDSWSIFVTREVRGPTSTGSMRESSKR